MMRIPIQVLIGLILMSRDAYATTSTCIAAWNQCGGTDAGWNGAPDGTCCAGLYCVPNAADPCDTGSYKQCLDYTNALAAISRPCTPAPTFSITASPTGAVTACPTSKAPTNSPTFSQTSAPTECPTTKTPTKSPTFALTPSPTPSCIAEWNQCGGTDDGWNGAPDGTCCPGLSCVPNAADPCDTTSYKQCLSPAYAETALNRPCVTPSPTYTQTAPPTGCPTTKAPTNSPTFAQNPPPTGCPTTKAPTKSPTTASPTGCPTTKSPTFSLTPAPTTGCPYTALSPAPAPTYSGVDNYAQCGGDSNGFPDPFTLRPCKNSGYTCVLQTYYWAACIPNSQAASTTPYNSFINQNFKSNLNWQSCDTCCADVHAVCNQNKLCATPSGYTGSP